MTALSWSHRVLQLQPREPGMSREPGIPLPYTHLLGSWIILAEEKGGNITSGLEHFTPVAGLLFRRGNSKNSALRFGSHKDTRGINLFVWKPFPVPTKLALFAVSVCTSNYHTCISSPSSYPSGQYSPRCQAPAAIAMRRNT